MIDKRSLIFFFIFFFCKESSNKEEFDLYVGGEKLKITINGKSIKENGLEYGKRFIISVDGCKDCSYNWFVDGDLKSAEKYVEVLMCGGEKEIEVFVKKGEEEKSKKFKVITVGSEKEKSEEVKNAINIYKDENLFIGYDDRETDNAKSKILKSIEVLQKYVFEENGCDLYASYSLALGKITIVLSEIQKLIINLFLGYLTPDEIKSLVDGVLEDGKKSLKAFQENPQNKDFSFRVKSLRVQVFKDYPETARFQENVEVILTGEHDMGDVYFLISLLSFTSGIFNTIISYNGSVEFLTKLPQRVYNTIQNTRYIGIIPVVENMLITEIIQNPAFLGLSPEATDRLKKAQTDFYNAFSYLQKSFDFIIQETDPQDDDIIRYWDCGKDGICPEDKKEPFVDINGNGKYDDSIDIDGDGKSDGREAYVDINGNGKWNDNYSSADEGEGNGRFDIGEQIGTEKIKLFGMNEIKLSVSGIIYNALKNKVFEEIAKNFISGVLDIGKITGLGTTENLKRQACSLGLPFPEIRIWEFFSTPTPLRDLLPLWDPNSKTFIIQRDTEPFKDAGFDKKFSWEYPEYHPLSNPDPDKDDFSSAEDGFDTDYDGKCTDRELVEAKNRKEREEEPKGDRDCIYFLQKPADGQDFGPEGNILFDWIDKNGNGVPDKGDLTEEWDDNYGIMNGKKGTCSSCIGNNKFDRVDTDHHWPDGRVDPRNGVGPGGMVCGYSGDSNGELIDRVYLLFQDPTFSGVLDFYPKEIKNPDGKVLTPNATLHRFFWKAYELLVQFGFIENKRY